MSAQLHFEAIGGPHSQCPRYQTVVGTEVRIPRSFRQDLLAWVLENWQLPDPGHSSFPSLHPAHALQNDNVFHLPFIQEHRGRSLCSQK